MGTQVVCVLSRGSMGTQVVCVLSRGSMGTQVFCVLSRGSMGAQVLCILSRGSMGAQVVCVLSRVRVRRNAKLHCQLCIIDACLVPRYCIYLRPDERDCAILL